MTRRVLTLAAAPAALSFVLSLGACAGPDAEKKPSEADAKAAETKPADPDSCKDAKDCLQKGAVANKNKDFAHAAKFLEPACEIEAKACNIAAELYRNGTGVTKDGAKAATLHGKACDKGLIVSCAVEAQLRYLGQDGAAVDKTRARVCFEKSCSPDFLDSCTNAGVMFASGEGGDKDPAKARTLYQKACDGNDQTACVNLAAMFLNGEGGDPDKAKARSMFEAACEKKNALGCYNAGLVYAKGIDGTPDFPKALTLLQQACDASNAKACEVAGQIRDDQARQAAAAQQAASKGKTKGKK